MTKRLSWWLVALAMLAPAVARGQGVLVVIDPAQRVRLPRPIFFHPPRPVEPTYKVDELQINARLVDQAAEVQTSQTFENTGSWPLEACFVFPLPYEGAIHQMTLLVDGKEHPARLLDATEARRTYEEIVRKNRDPALLEWMGTGMFQTSVFPIPPGAKRTVTLRYTQLCRLQEGLTDFLFPLSAAKYTSQPVRRIGVRIAVESQQAIKNVYSPTHAVEIQRPDDRHAVATYTAANETPASDFRLLYDVGRGPLSARVLSYRPDAGDDGYFLLLASPEIKAGNQRQRKTVMFVIDRSGSMSGQKIEQVRAALKYVLNNLREGDLFNIIAYDDQVESFRPELQRYNDETRRAALGFVEGVYAGGTTNIDGALKAAFAQLQDPHQPAYIVFLTDGLPTAGETREQAIVVNAKRENQVHARIFVFGVGYDVNGRFLDKLARENFGQSDYVRPNEDIEARVSSLYRRIESPAMTGVSMKFAFDELRVEEGAAVNRLYPKESFDLFAGEQLVVVGRYKKAGAAKVVVRGSVGGEERSFDFPASFVEKSNDETNSFVERLWAVRRIGEILDQLDLNGRNEELVAELVGLSKRHGILTPYTSFMADDSGDQRPMAWNVGEAGRRLRNLGDTSGVSGVEQRAFKGAAKRAAQAHTGVPQESLNDFAKNATGGGMGGQDYGGRASGPATFAMQVQREAAAAEKNVRNVGDRAFFRSNGQWIDSRLTPQQQSNAKRIKQFSREYFDLAARSGRTMSQYMAFDEPAMVSLDGQAYLIEP